MKMLFKFDPLREVILVDTRANKCAPFKFGALVVDQTQTRLYCCLCFMLGGKPIVGAILGANATTKALNKLTTAKEVYMPLNRNLVFQGKFEDYIREEVKYDPNVEELIF